MLRSIVMRGARRFSKSSDRLPAQTGAVRLGPLVQPNPSSLAPRSPYVINIAIGIIVGVIGAAPPIAAQTPPPEHDATALAKQTQNPVGDLVSVPLQFNFNTGGGLQDQTFLNLNVQPVIPFKLSS